MKILYKFTTRSRPHLFNRGMKSIIENSSSDNYHILVSTDIDDETMLKPFDYSNTTIISKTSKNKIDAINRDLNEFTTIYDWDILVNMSDDMVFTKKGFDDVIRKAFDYEVNNTHTVGSLDRCLHFPDGNRNDLITMAIMGREYYNRFNYIYHPDYISLWCDNEMTDVAKQLGCYKYVNEHILEHKHPAYGKGAFDRQYVKTESYSVVDEVTYHKRKANNFGI